MYLSPGREPSGVSPAAARRWSLAAGLLYLATAVAFVQALGGFGPVTGPRAAASFWLPLAVSAVTSAFLVGSASWYYVVERRKLGPVGGGLVSGVVTGSLSHVGMWFGQSLVQHIGSLGSVGRYGNPVVDVLLGLLMVFVQPVFLTPVSLMTAGLLTIPLAGTVGCLFGVVRRHLGGRTAAAGESVATRRGSR